MAMDDDGIAKTNGSPAPEQASTGQNVDTTDSLTALIESMSEADDGPSTEAIMMRKSPFDRLFEAVGRGFERVATLVRGKPRPGDPGWKPKWASKAPYSVDFARSVEFKTTRFHKGFDVRQVDSLVDRIAGTLSLVTSTSFDESKRMDSTTFEAAVLGLGRTWWRRGYAESDVIDFMAGAVSTLKSFEATGVILEAERTLMQALEGDDLPTTDNGAAVMQALLAWEKLSSARIAGLEAEIDSLKRRLTGRLH